MATNPATDPSKLPKREASKTASAVSVADKAGVVPAASKVSAAPAASKVSAVAAASKVSAVPAASKVAAESSSETSSDQSDYSNDSDEITVAIPQKTNNPSAINVKLAANVEESKSVLKKEPVKSQLQVPKPAMSTPVTVASTNQSPATTTPSSKSVSTPPAAVTTPSKSPTDVVVAGSSKPEDQTETDKDEWIRVIVRDEIKKEKERERQATEDVLERRRRELQCERILRDNRRVSLYDEQRRLIDLPTLTSEYLRPRTNWQLPPFNSDYSRPRTDWQPTTNYLTRRRYDAFDPRRDC